MTEPNTSSRGPLDTYEVQWVSGHVERIQAHQVIWPMGLVFSEPGARDNHVMLHGEVNGKWKLILSAPVSEIHSVRLVTEEEAVPGHG